MDESAHTTKPASTPPTTEVDQLLKMLELQGAARKSRPASTGSTFQTPAIRYGTLVAIVVFGLGSVGLMELFLSQLPRPAHPAPAVNPAASVSPSGRPDSRPQ